MGLNIRKIRRAGLCALALPALVLGSATAQAESKPAAASSAPVDTFEHFINGPNGSVLDGRQADTTVGTGLRQNLFAVARNDRGRIGVAALDLSTGQSVSILGDQAFPMASTSKIAVAATFLAGVDKGIYSLTNTYPLMVPVASRPFSSTVAPVAPGMQMSASTLIERMITRSDNAATDALLKAVGGPAQVTKWLRANGFQKTRIDRDIATLVRDDGEFDPSTHVDVRDSTPPEEMVRLVAGIYKGDWLSDRSTEVLVGAMTRTITGRNRIKAGLPLGTTFGHKTGTLNNTASDVGFIKMPDGRVVAVAIYVTGQGGKPQRDARIAEITRTLYNGFANPRLATGVANDNSRAR